MTVDAARLLVPPLRLDRRSVSELDRKSREAVALGVGGFVLFGGDAEEAAALIARIRERTELPLWFGADLERGAGQQFRGLSDLPPPAALAHHSEPERAVRTAAGMTAREARSVGLNWVLAPVLDLDVEPENPIVGTRSFGADPSDVAALGRAWIEACQAEGAAACMKHFPGHGRTAADSHAELPVVDEPREVLEADLEPFRAAAPVAATAMIGHVAYPALAGGGRRPATLEPAVARRLLRRELAFRGPAATDALNMAGFTAGTDDESEGRRAVAAVRAGCDLLLYPEDAPSVARALDREVARSDRFRGRVRRARERSEAALRTVGPAREASAAGDPEDEGPGARDPSPEELDRLAEDCVVSVGAPPEVVLPSDAGLEVRVVDDDEAGGEFGATFRETLTSERMLGPGARSGGRATVLILRSSPRAWKGRAGIGPEARRAVEAILADEAPVYPVVFGHRRLLDVLGRPGACAWWGRPRAERAAGRWLARRLRRGGPGG